MWRLLLDPFEVIIWGLAAVMILWYSMGCAHVPQTRDEWAVECLSQTEPEKTMECVRQWDAWERDHAVKE